MSQLIIAPTIGYKGFKETSVDDAAKDYANSIDLERKSKRSTSTLPENIPDDVEFKSHHDMKVIRTGIANARERELLKFDEMERRKSYNGVAFPQIDVRNTHHLQLPKP